MTNGKSSLSKNMTTTTTTATSITIPSQLSLYQLLDPDVLANPYPLYARLRTESPVHWDPYLHAWIVTRYADVITVLHRFSANRTPTPEQFAAIGLAELGPLAQVMVKQMLFMDAPDHTACAASRPPLSHRRELKICDLISAKFSTICSSLCSAPDAST